MKILIDNFSLAAGGTESPEDLRIEGRREVQAVALLRAATATVLPRGNRLNTISFTITREHDTYGDAESFLFAHAATLPASGTVSFYCEDLGGAQVLYTAQAAAIRSDLGTQRGVTTRHAYVVACGPLTGGSVGLA